MKDTILGCLDSACNAVDDARDNYEDKDVNLLEVLEKLDWAAHLISMAHRRIRDEIDNR